MTVRKGARTLKDIPADILQQLNTGQIESVNLMECLAIDQQVLLQQVLKQQQREHYFSEIQQQIEQIKKPTFNSLNATIGKTLFQLSQQYQDHECLTILKNHPADTVRNWSCYSVVENHQLSLAERFQQIYPLAADHHFGVREVAWMAIRPCIIQQLNDSIEILAAWIKDDDANIRRFASEATRPRGVWCHHIDALKQQPELALSILQPLYADPAKYVQDSVGNWLNDASKTQPEFVLKLCEQWQQQSESKATQYIVKKALRTLNKTS
ncbi:MAG: DNA alkylation repair protein [Acinetobacter sp.]|jgi:3-methyladenine DNA glycosylase AlkC|nr:MAG: DNA alkylation repair protein [Acinetobacter sp.]